MSNASTLTSSVEPGVMSRRLAFSAAGFIATSTFGVSPGVEISWSEMCTWNDDTPAIVPAGARISAGKFGSVARSLPKAAESSVKRSPTSCMPSPESPANRITTPPSVSTRRVGLASRVTVDLCFLGLRSLALLGLGVLAQIYENAVRLSSRLRPSAHTSIGR